MRRRTHLLGPCPRCSSLACGADAASESRQASAQSPAHPATAPGAARRARPQTPPAEKEVESDYEAPVATGRFVWVANPKSGRVAYVDATTLQVRTVEAGNAPTYLAGVPGPNGDTTLVLNVLSEDATLLHAEGAAITSRTFKVAKKANSLAFSSDGHYAIAWADSRKVPTAPRTQGFQDLTVLDRRGNLDDPGGGYRPVTVGFAAGSCAPTRSRRTAWPSSRLAAAPASRRTWRSRTTRPRTRARATCR